MSAEAAPLPALALKVKIAATPNTRDTWDSHSRNYAAGEFFYWAVARTETRGFFKKREVEFWVVMGWFKTREAALRSALKYAREEATRRRLRAEAEADAREETLTIICAFPEEAEPYVHTETQAP